MNWLPLPLDTLVGMYHPWRDFFGNLPFKNFILTDPVRQQYPWRELVISLLKNWQIPWWNPYNFAGTPLLANIQSAVFYPLNILFFIFNFPLAWGIYILSAPVLGFVFMFLYLRNLKLEKYASIFGSIAFALCGFNIAWLENGGLTHTLLWLPLILLAIDKKKYLLFLLSLLCSFYAGHWQTFFYVFLLANAYALIKYPKNIIRYIILNSLFIILALPQLLPSLQFISLSARSTDQLWQNNPGWFIPWQNLIQFISPDFFGNPSTLNYKGIFSYQEFVGYLGIPALFFALSALFIKRKIVWFFGGAMVIALLFALPTPLAKLPFILNLPLVSSSMPTRLLSIICFSLSVLAAFGFQKSRRIVVIGLVIFLLVFWAFSPSKYLIIPSAMLLLTLVFRKHAAILILLLCLDLGWFAYKFLPFSNPKYLYPETKVTRFLQENTRDGAWRFMTLNDEIFPPNFNIIYRLQSINGYDPLYLKSYGALVGGGNRILVPKDYKNPLMNQLGVKYILSFEDISSPNYQLIFQEGKTLVFENKNVMPRSSGQSKIVSYEPNRIVVETYNPKQETLILSDMYYPGWKTTVDDSPVAIIPTELNFRSVLVPAGKHTVIFKI